MWLSLALFSALLFGIRRIYEKELTGTFGNFSLGFVVQSFSVIPILALFFFLPIPQDIWALPWRFWWPLIIIWLVLYPIQTYFLYRSLREGEVSEVVPVGSLLPVFNVVSSYVLIGEIPTRYGLVGILAIVVATYILLKDAPGVGKFRINMPVLFMVIATLLPAIGSTLDKISIEVSTPVFYSFVNQFGVSIVFLVCTFAFGQQQDLKRIPEKFWLLVSLGLVLAFGFTASMAAFVSGETSYVLAIRSAGFLLPVAWGLFFLREHISRRKIVALGLFAAGIVLLSFS